METAKKQSLDFDKTYPYFIDHLSGWHTLAEMVTQTVDFHKGSFSIFLPQDAKIELLYQFSGGGINPLYDVHRVITISTICSWIKNHLEKDCYAICSWVVSTIDDLVPIPNVKAHAFNQEVYYSLKQVNSLDDIDATIGWACTDWHTFIVLCSLPEPPPPVLTQEDLSTICANIRYVIAGAHDGENYIIWEKN